MENKSPFPPFWEPLRLKKEKYTDFRKQQSMISPNCTFFTIFRTICCVRFKNFYQQQSCKCANQDSEKFTRKKNSLELTTI